MAQETLLYAKPVHRKLQKEETAWFVIYVHKTIPGVSYRVAKNGWWSFKTYRLKLSRLKRRGPVRAFAGLTDQDGHTPVGGGWQTWAEGLASLSTLA